MLDYIYLLLHISLFFPSEVPGLLQLSFPFSLENFLQAFTNDKSASEKFINFSVI